MDSLPSLQHRLRTDFSESVLLLHGLSGWPSTWGSYALCEVDLSEDSSHLSNEREVQFVLQAIPGIYTLCKVSGIEDNSRSNSHEKVNEREHPEAPCEADSRLQTLEGERNVLGEEEQQHRERFAKTGESCLDTVSTKFIVPSRPSTIGTGEEFEDEVSSLTSQLAILDPGLRICPASYNKLVYTFKELHGKSSFRNHEQKVQEPGDSSIDSALGNFNHRSRTDKNVENNVKDSNNTMCSKNTRHPNLAPILGAFQGESCLYMVFGTMPFTLQSLLHFSPGALGEENHVRFLIFQILSGLAYCHSRGLTHGDLRPSNILLTDNLWCMITGFLRFSALETKYSSMASKSPPSWSTHSTRAAEYAKKLHPSYNIRGFLSEWRDVIRRWWAGEVSNYDYLLLLNKLAGRRWGDPCFHTVVPWVIDFSVKPDQESKVGWRDLTKSKWRLAKGDEQLDFTYASAEMPHHVSDECLSELAVCIYKARRLPLLVLRRIVRSVYEPNEYPVNMQRLYQWTPDECVPEFYSDPHVFESIHNGMNDLAVPAWAKSAKEFISLHRAALESDRVSRELHHWIDLTFGFKLSGKAAIAAKNVTLSTVGPAVPRSSGRRQLFLKPHPKRQHCKIADVHKRRKDSIELLTDQTWMDSKEQNQATSDTRTVLNVNNLENGLAFRDKDKLSKTLFSKAVKPLTSLEALTSFYESARYLSPCYRVPLNFKEGEGTNQVPNQPLKQIFSAVSTIPSPRTLELVNESPSPYDVDIIASILEDKSPYKKLIGRLDFVGDEKAGLYESICLHQKRIDQCKQVSPAEREDIFALGCLIAELYLRKPLFDPVTADAYRTQGSLPDLMECLPPYVRCLVEWTLHKEYSRRPTTSTLLQSPFFSPLIRAVYFFLAPLHLLTSRLDQLQYVVRMARQGAFVSMGETATEMCTPTCLSLIVPSYKDIDVEAVVVLMTKLLRALKPRVSKRLLVPVFQRLLQSQDSLSLKVALLQVPLIKELWRVVGTVSYLQYIHSSVLASLRRAPSSGQATAASKILVSMCLDLGVPITLHQTVLPLLQSFGRDITVDHIEVLIGIGEQIGEKLVVKHLLPSLRNIVTSNVDFLVAEQPGPAHSWRLSAMVDAMAVLDRLRVIVSPGTALKEFLQEPHNVYVKVLSHQQLSPNLLQCAAKALLLVCGHVGAEATTSFLLPQLKKVFDELAFAGKLDAVAEKGKPPRSTMRTGQVSQSFSTPVITQSLVDQENPLLLPGGSNLLSPTEGMKMEGDIALVYMLYTDLAALVGIERLRKGLTTWLLLEQALLKHCNWKWESLGVLKAQNMERVLFPESSNNESVNPANLLLDGIGWSIPQSQASKWGKSPNSSRRLTEASPEKLRSVSDNIFEHEGPWSWSVRKDPLWSGEAFGRIGIGLGLAQDDYTWSLNSTILHSWKSHTGLVRCIVVSEDENTLFTVGGGPRGGSVVRQWKLSTSECVVEYAGHDEAVNDVCILPGGRRVASCDGTVHIWNFDTGQRVAFFDESSKLSLSPSSSSGPLSSLSVAASVGVLDGESGKNHYDLHHNNGAAYPNYSSTASFTGGGLYSCLHCMEAEERLVAGMVNGSLRFIDIVEDRQLYSWRCEPLEASLSSFVSAIASSGQGESKEGRKYSSNSSWVAVGFGSGICRLMDFRSGGVVCQWRAHDSLITKLSVLEENYLVSSSLDKTLSLWDLRRGASPERLQVFQGHKRGVTSFALKGCDVLSAAGSKIGLSTLFKSTDLGGDKQSIKPQKLYSIDRGNRLLYNISAISILPFSRLFLVGTEDGHLKICT